MWGRTVNGNPVALCLYTPGRDLGRGALLSAFMPPGAPAPTHPSTSHSVQLPTWGVGGRAGSTDCMISLGHSS